jgi:hypothetical protein
MNSNPSYPKKRPWPFQQINRANWPETSPHRFKITRSAEAMECSTGPTPSHVNLSLCFGPDTARKPAAEPRQGRRHRPNSGPIKNNLAPN